MTLRDKLYVIIFEADTKVGKRFDVALIILILVSICLVMLDSISGISAVYHNYLRTAEWGITLLFTLEYILRTLVVRKPLSYMSSFYGLVDLLAVLPTYISIFITGGQSLVVIRAIRLLRIFRILKLSRYTRAGRFLVVAIYRSREKIFIFLSFILTIVIIFGTIMYLVEGEESGFSSIPTSIYWAIVTLTTVGYGDISPVTGIGQFLASLIMIMGYAIIAVPTGIVTSEMLHQKITSNTQVCQGCMFDRHDDDALYCKNCGQPLDPEKNKSEAKTSAHERQ